MITISNDVHAVTEHMSHLSLEGERRLRCVGTDGILIYDYIRRDGEEDNMRIVFQSMRHEMTYGPQIAVVGATVKLVISPSTPIMPTLLAPTRESRSKSGWKSSRATRNDSPPSQQALPIRQMPSQSQTQGPTPLMYMPPSSSPLATEVDNGPPLPIPSPRGLEDSPSHGLETRMEEIMPAGTHGDEGDEETWDSNLVSFPPPSSMPPTSRPHWQSGEVGNNVAVPQIWVTSFS